MACGCSRLRLAGTTLDGIYALHPYSWNGLWGYPGRRGDNQPVIGRPGAYRVPNKEADERIVNLGIQIRDKDTFGTRTLDACEHLELNQDVILGLAGEEEPLTLEWDRANGTTRYLEVNCDDAAPIMQQAKNQRIACIFRAPYPQWREGALVTTAIATGGGTNINPGGNAPVEDAVVTWTANGRVTNTTNGEHIELAAAVFGAPIILDLEDGTVLQGATSRTRLISSVGTDRIFRLEKNVVNNLVATVAGISVGHRPNWW